LRRFAYGGEALGAPFSARSSSQETRDVCHTIQAAKCRPARKGITGTSMMPIGNYASFRQTFLLTLESDLSPNTTESSSLIWRPDISFNP
jgi:hypothetical protein